MQNLLENYIPTAIATLIEPLWVLINRLLCLLQPIEELQSGKAKAKSSIDLNYSSLPPQLVLFKALRTGHLIVATVCFMALLANVLSIAFAGLFHHDVTVVLRSVSLRMLTRSTLRCYSIMFNRYVTLLELMVANNHSHQTNFAQPFDLRFVPIDGSVGPAARETVKGPGPSGAYFGGDGRDQFYILNSNMSNGTPLPPWTDEKLFYFPSVTADEVKATNEEQFQIETTSLGAELNCKTVKTTDLRIKTDQDSLDLSVDVQRDGIQAKCSSESDWKSLRITSGPELNETSLERICLTGASAIELVVRLVPSNPNATQEEQDICLGTVVLGWARDPKGTCSSSNLTDFDVTNSLFLQCNPRLTRGKYSQW